MFLKGYTKLSKVLSDEELSLASRIIEEKQHLMNNENDGGIIYKNSKGLASIPELDPIYDRLTDIVRNITGLKIKKENSYSRVYSNDSKLAPHTDREGLDLTMSVQVSNKTGIDCPLSLRTYDGISITKSLFDGDAILLKGRDLLHWREPIIGTEGNLTCIFFHWRILSQEFECFDKFLDPKTCNDIIAYSEGVGFKNSEVIQDKKNVYDPHSRSSKSIFLEDKFGLTDKMKKTLGFPVLQVEGYQVLKYGPGEKFSPHYDNLNIENDRLFTVIINLNEHFEGGTTTFTNTNEVIHPKTGQMSIWKNISSGVLNPLSMHSGDPVISGYKYVIVTWLLKDFKQ